MAVTRIGNLITFPDERRSHHSPDLRIVINYQDSPFAHAGTSNCFLLPLHTCETGPGFTSCERAPVWPKPPVRICHKCSRLQPAILNIEDVFAQSLENVIVNSVADLAFDFRQRKIGIIGEVGM